MKSHGRIQKTLFNTKGYQRAMSEHGIALFVCVYLRKNQIQMSEQIKFDANNLRHHDERNRELIRTSLEKYKAGRSALMDADNTLIAGNGAVREALDLKIPIKIIDTDGSEMIILRRTDIESDSEIRTGLAIADNATTDASSWDHDKIRALEIPVEELDAWDIDISLLREPHFDELIRESKDKPATIKITFATAEQLRDAEHAIKKIIESHEGSFYSVSAGEI